MNEKKQKQRGLKQGFELIYKYRFVLSFLLLILLVSLKISGSSMGCWKLFLGDGESGIRLGEPRVWRNNVRISHDGCPYTSMLSVNILPSVWL